MRDLSDAIRGGMVGLAIGDALGFASEFRSRAKILATFGPQGITDFVAQLDPRWPVPPHIVGHKLPPGTYSDDTQMAICVAEAILSTAGRDLDALMVEMGRRFVEWSDSPDNNRAPGETCMTGCRNLAAGVSWRGAGVAQSKGCGSVMRVAPIGLVLGKDRAWLLEVSRASSVLTHGHDAAVESCAAIALAVDLALHRTSPEDIVRAVTAECAPRSPDLAEALRKLSEHRNSPPELALSEAGVGEGWVAEEAAVSALYCFLRSPDDFEATVLTGTNTDGDSDSIACIAGAISGAYNGLAAIPSRWRERVENTSYLHALGDRLAARRSSA